MSASRYRLSRPVYEGLPWAYLLAGLLGLIASYCQTSPVWSVALGLPGLLAVMAGAVVLLRRRAYRRLRAQYDAPDGLNESTTSTLPTEPGPQ